jgi:hypothetical protein
MMMFTTTTMRGLPTGDMGQGTNLGHVANTFCAPPAPGLETVALLLVALCLCPLPLLR